MAGFALYCLGNGSGHTGFEPMAQLPFHGLVIASGIGLWWLKARAAGLLAAVAGTLGAGFLVYVDALMIMRGYEQWLSSGMPERNPHAAMLILLYGAITAAVLGATWAAATRLE